MCFVSFVQNGLLGPPEGFIPGASSTPGSTVFSYAWQCWAMFSFPEDRDWDTILARRCVILTGCLQHLGLKGAFLPNCAVYWQYCLYSCLQLTSEWMNERSLGSGLCPLRQQLWDEKERKRAVALHRDERDAADCSAQDRTWQSEKAEIKVVWDLVSFQLVPKSVFGCA